MHHEISYALDPPSLMLFALLVAMADAVRLADGSATAAANQC